MKESREANLIKGQDVYLRVCDEGLIWVSFPDKWYKLSDRNIQYIADRAFLMLSAIDGTRINFLLPLKLSEEQTSRDFLGYWGEKRLLEVKNNKWTSFLEYWKDTTDYISQLIDLDKYQCKFKYYVDDYRDCDEGFSPQFEVRIPKAVLYDLGLSDEQSFDLLWDLTNLVQSRQIELHCDSNDEYYWFSRFNITFRYIGEE